MRILLTTDTIGGVWTFTAQLTEGLLRRGHEVALLSFGRMPSLAQQGWADRILAVHREQFRFIASDVALEWMPENDDLLQKTAAVLGEVLEDFGADLLHANHFCAAMDGSGMPTLLTVHSDVLSWAEACRPEGLADSSWLRNYRAIAQEGLLSADAIVAPSQWLAEALRRIYKLAREVGVVSNGCTLPRQSTVARKLQAVTAGRLWDEAKGLALLTEFRSPMPLLIAGEAPEPAPSLPPGSTLLGALSADALHGLFHESAIYLATSVYEPFGLAPLEAALCGCAVVARDIPSLREVWADGALYFNDAASLQELLTRLAVDAPALAEAKKRSYQRASRYSADAMTESYLQLYKQLPLRTSAAHRQAEPEVAHAR